MEVNEKGYLGTKRYNADLSFYILGFLNLTIADVKRSKK